MSKLGPISHFLSLVSCDSLEWEASVLNLVLSLSLAHTGHWKFNIAPHGNDLKIWIWKKELLLYIKMA